MQWKRQGAAIYRTGALLALALSAALLALGCHDFEKPRDGAADGRVSDRVTVAAPARFETPLTDGGILLSDSQAAEYAGDASCANCHEAPARNFGETRHARTLRPVTVEEQGAFFRNAAPIRDPVLNYVYTAGVQDGRCVIVGKSGKQRGALPADYLIGTGKNARTYLSVERPNSWVDLRISYYTHPEKWDFTPAQRPGERVFTRAAGITQDGPKLPACLKCHITYLRGGVDGLDIKRSHIGIGCERCHGPGRSHIAAIGRPSFADGTRPIAMERYGTATPARINTLCGQCHHDEGNSQPGDPKTENGLARFEGVALVRSKCYQASGTLSCITCHDPHRDASSNAAANEAKCLACHSDTAATHPAGQPPRKSCSVNPKSGCIGCHMPAQKIATIPYALYHNHWIKVWRR